MKKKVLIIGGDSKIAKYLIKRLKKENITVDVDLAADIVFCCF